MIDSAVETRFIASNAIVANQATIANQDGDYQDAMNRVSTGVLGEIDTNQQQLTIDQNLANQFIQIKGSLGNLGEIIQKDGQFYLAKNIIENGNIKRHTIKKINLDSGSVDSRIIEDHSIDSEDLKSHLAIEHLQIKHKLDIAGGLDLTGDFNVNDKFFVDATLGNVGIGTMSPQAKLAVSGLSSDTTASVNVYRYGGSSGGTFLGLQARGTEANPTATQLGDNLFFLGARGYGATGFPGASRAAVAMYASQIWNNASQGTYITFETTPNNSTTRTERLRILDNGNVGIGTTSPIAKLDIYNTANVSPDISSIGLNVYGNYTGGTSASVRAGYYGTFINDAANTNYRYAQGTTGEVYIGYSGGTTNWTGIVTDARGITGYVNNYSSGAGVITYAYGGFFGTAVRAGGSGIIRNAYGINISGASATGTDAGQTHNAYGLFIANSIDSSGGAINNSWAVYSATTKSSYFSGSIGIGNTNPLSKLGTTGNASIGATYGAIAAPTSGMIIEGNIGIGTTSPNVKLDVNGKVNAVGYSTSWGTTSGVSTGAFNAILGTGSSATWLLSGTSGGVFKSGIQMLDAGTTMRIYSDASNYFQISSGNISNIASITMSGRIDNSYANAAALNMTGNAAGITFTGTGTNQIITASGVNLAFMPGGTGNVGIGTISPVDKLGIAGTSNPTIGIYQTTVPITGVTIGTLKFNSQDSVGTQYSAGKIRSVSESEWGTTIRSGLAFDVIKAAVPQLNVMYINQDGNVGIGSTAPGARLQVVGSDSLNTSFSANLSGATGTGLVVTNSGNVGIGSTAPGARLQVVG
ncbi:MAG: hypothetical protein WCK16_03860, partial [Candidatus Moraniibacteriota bacterium]